jgi:uncharacterized protein (DUF302 family)
MEVKNKLGRTVRLKAGFEQAEAQVTQALKAEGFGVLTEIDVKQTLKQKLDVDFRSYKILGACNPPLAHRALTAAPEVGLLLPCNVTVADAGDGFIEVSLVDPLELMQMVSGSELQAVAAEAAARLDRVAAALQQGQG